MKRLGPLLGVVTLALAAGCGGPALGPAPADLPPAYTRADLSDPRLIEVARQFTAWAEKQQAADHLVFGRIEILPTTETLSPYGVGTLKKEPRLPVILTTGPGWSDLKPDEREALVAKTYRDLAGQLDALKLKPPLRPTLTIQTPQGLELAWIDDLFPGRKLLHGDGD